MPKQMKTPRERGPVQCVGIICFRGDDVLLIRRGTAPRQGEWSIPGGRIEPGESQANAALRELREETGVAAALGPKVELVRAAFEGQDYDLHDYVALWMSGEPTPGDDAAEALFVPLGKIQELDMWPKTYEVIIAARKRITRKA